MSNVRNMVGLMLLSSCVAWAAPKAVPAKAAPKAPKADAAAPAAVYAEAAVGGIKVQPDKAPDCSSLKSIVESVTRGCKNNDEKAVAIYNFMNLTHYHFAYPNESKPIPALKAINCYGWSLCGGLHTVESALWRELGWGWRFVGWSNPGHTTVEAQYDGRWHYLDIFLKFYAWMPDGKGGRTIAGQEDLQAGSQALLIDGMVLDHSRNCVYAADNAFVVGVKGVNWQAPAFLSCGDTVKGIISGINSRKVGGASEVWNGMAHATGSYSTDVTLAPGYAMENTWDSQTNAWYWKGGKRAPRHTCNAHKDTRNDPAYGLVLEPYIDSRPGRGYGNGSLDFAPDFASENVVKSFVAVDNARYSGKALVPADAGKPGRVTFSLASPYILTLASGEATGAETVEVSTDGGVKFVAVDIKDFSEAVKGFLAVLVRVTFKEPLSALKVRAVFQNNPGALPFLSPGRNEVAVSVNDPKSLGNNELVVTYAYRLGYRTKSFEQLCGGGREIAKQHGAKWSDVVTVVRKRYSAKDLPAKMVIDCPTPKGQYPVYPRMVFLRREVVTKGGAVLPLPEGAVEAKPAADAELQTLPDPFLIGTQPPPAGGRAKSAAVRKAEGSADSDSSSAFGGGGGGTAAAAASAPVGSTLKVPFAYVGYLCGTGGAAGVETILHWPKKADAPGKVIPGIVVVKGEMKELAGKKILAARLVVPVKEGHNKADTRIGAVVLREPVQAEKTFGDDAFAAVAGTCVVPEQTEPAYKPGKPFAIDVTDAIMDLAASPAPFYGFAVRVVPDRQVDNGYTVKCKLSAKDTVMLEIDLAKP